MTAWLFEPKYTLVEGQTMKLCAEEMGSLKKDNRELTNMLEQMI
jgi:hypothetical protein